MKRVNFKKYYDHITTDTYHDVPDEVFDILEEYRKAEGVSKATIGQSIKAALKSIELFLKKYY